MLCTLADLKNEDLTAINNLESKTGKVMLAFSCQDYSPANLDPDDLAALQKLESNLGVSLVAVEP